MTQAPGPKVRGPVLEIGVRSFETRHAVSAIAWVCFEDIVLAARRDESGELSLATGVRELAMRLGVTKNTAARAVAALVDEGLLRRSQVRDEKGSLRSGYVVTLVDGIRVSDPPAGSGSRTGNEDSEVCIGNRDTSRRNEIGDSRSCLTDRDGSICIDLCDKHPRIADEHTRDSGADRSASSDFGSSPNRMNRRRRRRAGLDDNQLTLFDDLESSANVDAVARH